MGDFENMLKRVSEETKKVMQELRDKGFSYAAIGKILGFSPSAVQYHLNPKYKEQVKKAARRRNNVWEGKKEYMTKYMADRYKDDEEFREKVKENSRKWNKKDYDKKKEVKK